MNKETAFDLLSNLLERARDADEKTFLTSREIEALGVFLGVPDSKSVSRGLKPVSQIAPIIRSITIPDDEIDPKLSLCIDFGTSFSKAFACNDTGADIPEIIDLPIGGHRGSEGQLTTPSEILIDAGLIYFGVQARKIFDDSEASPDRLIDSIKQYMTLGTDVTNLAKIRVDAAKDPDQKFFQRDVLLLYLAHLTRLTERALESKGRSINARRRFAHPAWGDANRKKNEDAMRRMMAEAIVLARSLGDQLLESLSVSDARAALDHIQNLEGGLPLNLIAEPVREATAAGAGALLGAPEHTRQAYIIVDVGAGTTDVAGCYCVNNPAWNRPRVFEVSTAADAIKSAGNVLDNALVMLLLSSSHLVAGSAEYSAAAAYLTRHKRSNKERLFDNEEVLVELPTGDVLEVKLNDFLKYEPVVTFAENVRRLVAKSAFAVAGDAEKITFVATGGGANLPIIDQIVRDGVEHNGKRILFTRRDPAPQGLAVLYPDLVDPYPQIAVAIGGSLPQLPEQRADITEGIHVPPPYTMMPTYKS